MSPIPLPLRIISRDRLTTFEREAPDVAVDLIDCVGVGWVKSLPVAAEGIDSRAEFSVSEINRKSGEIILDVPGFRRVPGRRCLALELLPVFAVVARPDVHGVGRLEIRWRGRRLLRRQTEAPEANNAPQQNLALVPWSGRPAGVIGYPFPVFAVGRTRSLPCRRYLHQRGKYRTCRNQPVSHQVLSNLLLHC